MSLPSRIEPPEPQNLDAEESVLGAMLLDRHDAVKIVREQLDATDFYGLAHGTIYTAMLALDASGQPVDTITVADELRRRGELEGIGGKGRLDELIALGVASPKFRITPASSASKRSPGGNLPR